MGVLEGRHTGDSDYMPIEKQRREKRCLEGIGRLKSKDEVEVASRKQRKGRGLWLDCSSFTHAIVFEGSVILSKRAEE